MYFVSYQTNLKTDRRASVVSDHVGVADPAHGAQCRGGRCAVLANPRGHRGRQRALAALVEAGVLS